MYFGTSIHFYNMNIRVVVPDTQQKDQNEQQSTQKVMQRIVCFPKGREILASDCLRKFRLKLSGPLMTHSCDGKSSVKLSFAQLDLAL